jgi:hypothetical protein
MRKVMKQISQRGAVRELGRLAKFLGFERFGRTNAEERSRTIPW